MSIHHHQRCHDLFDIFSSTAAQRIQYTASVTGPSCPIIATTSASTNKNEIHLQRMPRSVTKGVKDFFTGYKQAELIKSSQISSSSSKIELVIENILDQVISKLLPDGSRVFQCFISSLILEMNEDRNLRGLLSSSVSANERMMRVLNESILTKREELIEMAKKATLENKIVGRQQQKQQDSNSHHQKNDQEVPLPLLQSCLLRIAQTDSDGSSSSSTLAQIATSIALAAATNTTTTTTTPSIHFVDLIGFPITNSRVLQTGSLLMSIPDDFHHTNLVTNRIRRLKNFTVILIKKFDFINYCDDDDSTSSSLSCGSSSSDEDDEHIDYIDVPRSISDIVQLYRQEINLSDTKKSTKKQEDDWLTQLVSFCRSCRGGDVGTNHTLLLCQQKLPEAARCVNEGTAFPASSSLNSSEIVLYDGVEHDIMIAFANMTGSENQQHACRIPYRADRGDISANCIVQNVVFTEVRFPNSTSSESRTIFEVTTLNSSSTSKYCHLQSAIICAPTVTIAKDLKNLVMKLIRCVKEAKNEEQPFFFVKDGFSTLLSFSRLCSSSPSQSPVIKCFGRAAGNTVIAIMMSNRNETCSNLGRNRSSEFMKVMREPDKLNRLKFDFVQGEWKSEFEGVMMISDACVENPNPEFSWLLPNMIVGAIEFLSILLKSDVYCG